MSECSSCSIKQDKSAYWTPSLYWENPEGQFIALNQTAGMQVYYHLRGQSIEPFPQDFRIIAGDSHLRDFPSAGDGIEKSDYAITGLSANQDYLRQKAIAFTCLNYSAPAEPALAINALPQRRRCPNGLRAEIMFPSCWNGVDSDSYDHRSHVKYPSTVDDGYCPEGYQNRIPSLFFETIWDIEAVSGKGGRLVFSNGDPTGKFLAVVRPL